MMMAGRRQAEMMVAALRWVALALAIVAVSESVRAPLLIIGAVIVAAYNGAVVWATRSDQRFAGSGLVVAFGARLLDFAMITALVRAIPHGGSNLYLLYVFAIVTTAYVHSSARAVGYAVGGSVILNALGVLSQRPLGEVDLGVLAANVLLLIGAAVIGAQLVLTQRQTTRIRHQDDRLAVLLASAINTTTGDDPHALMQEAAEMAQRETHARWAGLFVRDMGCEDLTLEVEAGEGLPPPATDERLQHVCNSRQALLLLDGRDPGRPAPGGEGEGVDTASIVAPLLGTLAGQRGEVLGVMLVEGETDEHQFDEDDLDLVRALAAKAALVLANTTLYHRLHASVLKTMQSLARTLEARDEYTRGHSERVAGLSQAIAEEMSLDQDAIDLLVSAALLHDIGKIGIPDRILCKTEGLADDEWQLVREHSNTSCEICRPLELGDDVLFLIQHHHERLNGRGYPGGLPSHEQPLPLRILSVADTFDAMSTDRPYRRALDLAARVEELNRCAGLEFDQRVVETLKLLLNNGRLAAMYAQEKSEPVREKDPVAS